MMKKVLVTGGAGFIGSHVCEALLNRGDAVLCIDSFNDYYDPCIKEKNIKGFLGNPNFELFRFDVGNIDLLRGVFRKGVDRVIHLAALAGVRPSIENPETYVKNNVLGTLNMLEVTREFGVKNFVFASSSSVYGSRSDGPFREDDRADSQISPYAATKKTGELLCNTYNKVYGLNASCLRFFTVYGSRGRPDMAPLKFTDKIARGEEIEIYGDGNAIRDFTHVSDVVDGILLALDNAQGYEIFNLGCSNPIKLIEFVRAIENALGKKASIKFVEPMAGDVPLTHSDSSKARKVLGFNPKVSLAGGVKELVDWYVERNQNKFI